MSVDTGTYSKGLEGIIADETAVSRIDGQKGKLYYRGYAIEDLAATFRLRRGHAPPPVRKAAARKPSWMPGASACGQAGTSRPRSGR